MYSSFTCELKFLEFGRYGSHGKALGNRGWCSGILLLLCAEALNVIVAPALFAKFVSEYKKEERTPCDHIPFGRLRSFIGRKQRCLRRTLKYFPFRRSIVDFHLAEGSQPIPGRLPGIKQYASRTIILIDISSRSAGEQAGRQPSGT
jgi:hypothetical protein